MGCGLRKVGGLLKRQLEEIRGCVEDSGLKPKPFIIVMYVVCATFLVFGYILLFKDGWAKAEDFLKLFFNKDNKLFDKGLGVAVSTACFFSVLGGYQAMRKQLHIEDRKDNSGEKKCDVCGGALYIFLWVFWLAIVACGVMRVALSAKGISLGYSIGYSQLFCVTGAALALVAVGLQQYFNKKD